MTLRERIADWIMYGLLKKWVDHATELQSRLDRIAFHETPGANATVRRMARIARGEE